MASSNFVNGNDVATFVLETDAPYNILDFDQGLCTMTGYSPRELSKKIWIICYMWRISQK